MKNIFVKTFGTNSDYVSEHFMTHGGILLPFRVIRKLLMPIRSDTVDIIMIMKAVFITFSQDIMIALLVDF